MLAPRSLPPTFLLPAWSGQQLSQLCQYHASSNKRYRRSSKNVSLDEAELARNDHAQDQSGTTKKLDRNKRDDGLLPFSRMTSRAPPRKVEGSLKTAATSRKTEEKDIYPGYRRFRPGLGPSKGYLVEVKARIPSYGRKAQSRFISLGAVNTSDQDAYRVLEFPTANGHDLGDESSGVVERVDLPPRGVLPSQNSAIVYSPPGLDQLPKSANIDNNDAVKDADLLRQQEISLLRKVTKMKAELRELRKQRLKRGEIKGHPTEHYEQAAFMPVFRDSNVYDDGSEATSDIRSISPVDAIAKLSPKTKTVDKIPQEVLKKQTPIKKSKMVSILEELFPFEAENYRRQSSPSSADAEIDVQDVPRLEPPSIPELLGDYSQLSHIESARPSPEPDYKEENLTVMVVSAVSTGLVDADFRRIIPRGEHIEDWRGPGDVLKIIPLRDAKTLEPKTSYLLVFANPAYAHVYKTHLETVHAMSRARTPTSLESPVFTEYKGKGFLKPDQVPQLMKDYTISPPSQDLLVRVIPPPYDYSLRNILAARGYEQLTYPENKAGRSVLFWVNGHMPSDRTIAYMLQKDSADRGVLWGPVNGKGSIKALGRRHMEDDEQDRSDMYQRYVISMEHETEARRFVRTWHLKPWPFHLVNETPPRGEPMPLIQATFLW